jgi:OCT family organic cation transporter-like MFS transporter 4/5
VGKGVVVSGFCTTFLYASELFPTVLRGVAIGHCGFWGRVGSLLAPQLLFLVTLYKNTVIRVEREKIHSLSEMIL